jgi:acyl carrier protein
MDKIPLPVAIALIATTTGCIYFFVKAWIAAKERDQNALDTRFDDVYNHINKVEESLDRRISDENAAMWRNIDDINDRMARKSK